MQKDSNREERNDIFVYLLAGVATSPLFMESLRLALHKRLEQHVGVKVQSELLFPYGDRSRRLAPQLWEIRHDMRLSLRSIARSIGGNRIVESIEPQLQKNKGHRTSLFIGHSGGGVAALHSSQLLMNKSIGSPPSAVVMVGSPRVRIPDNLQQLVLSLHATGKKRDLITKLGTFGGLSYGGLRRLPTWQSNKHAPTNIQGLPIIGGHADYFRDRAPFINQEGKSNLDISLEAIESWLYPQLR